MSVVTFEQCLAEVEAGTVYQRTSSCGNFCLFNYNAMTDFKNLWTDVNVWCRGIVFDMNTKEVVALPFKKFWNVGQKLGFSDLAKKGTPRVMSKEDGSLGVFFWDRYKEIWRVSTRGSFESEQAQFATDWIQAYSSILPTNKNQTHLFEIVYPQNQIVVNYIGFSGLIYLGSRDIETGEDCSDYSFFGTHFRTCQLYNFFSFEVLNKVLDSSDKNFEGFVLLYSDGTMAKMKGEEYKRVHRLRSSMSIANYAETVKIHRNFQAALDIIPDEFWNDYREPMIAFEKAVTSDWDLVRQFVSSLPLVTNVGGFQLEIPIEMTRRDKALFAQKNLPSHLLGPFFCLLDNKEQKAFDQICDHHVDSGKFRFKTFSGE